ncbi:MAG: ribonuclease III [Candidatus Gracilibacteria bacterium]|nr:ribonuclease III [Candidatus Gracilibacteria bacterium]
MVVSKSLYEDERFIFKVNKLLKELGIEAKNINHYLLSFVHRSFVNEKADVSDQHNERLEFLGDAVLELVVTSHLYNDFPKKPEGELTDIRSSLVRGRNLAIVAKKVNFPDYLILGKGEDQGGGRENNYILANTVEAFLGAIYLDLGYSEAEKFIIKHIYSTLEDILKNNLIKDPKSLLQEYTQADICITPSYNVLSETGPDHDKTFVVGVYLDEKMIGEGKGSSKKKAQEDAALNAYNTRNEWEKNFKKFSENNK